MGKHARNNTAGSVFTQYERQKMAQAVGSQKQRLGKDSVKNFDACSLCLQTATDPRSCPEGHLYCKECIYSSLLSQRQEIKRQTKLYEKQQAMLADKAARIEAEDKAAALKKFEETEVGILSSKPKAYKEDKDQDEQRASKRPAKVELAQGWEGGLDEPQRKVARFGVHANQEHWHNRSSFWDPNSAPEAKATILDKPDTNTKCAEGSHNLKLKQLVEVKLTPVRGGDGKTFECAACQKTLTNASKAALMKPCGHVLCAKCTDSFVVSAKACQICSAPLPAATDIIRLQTGGTGYAGHGDELEATKFRPAARV